MHRLVPRCAGDGALDNSTGIQRVNAAPVVRQLREYKTISWQFSDVADGNLVTVHMWYEDGVEHKGDLDMISKMQELGDQGWDLVSITPRSTPLNHLWQLDFVDNPNGHHPGTMDGYMVNGYDNEVLYYFKRPKQ